MRTTRSPFAACLFSIAAALAFLVPGGSSRAADTTAPASVGAVEFAGRLARDHWHLFGAEKRAELEQLNREMREATQQYEGMSDPGAKADAAQRMRAANNRLRALVTQHPRIVRLDLTSGRPRLEASGPVAQPGDTGALLFEVIAGGEGHRFSTTVRDLTEQPRGSNATLVIVDVGGTGVTHAVAGLEHLPVGRTTLLVEFRRPGEGTIRLPLDVTTPEPGRLKLTVLSDDTGQPSPAMVRLTWRTDGRARPPANAIDLAPQFDANGRVTGERNAFLPGVHQGSFWCSPEPFDMTLAPGVWEIAVGTGFEHTPVFEEVTIRPGETVEKTIRPRRWVDMRARGWWSGDDHVHGRMISDQDARNLLTWAQAEDVHLTNLVEMGDIYRTYFEQRGFGPQFRVQAGEYVLAPAQESPRTRDIGHVLTMNITGMVHDTDRYFLYDEVLDAIHAQGGLTGYAHAATGMFEAHRDMTLNVPRGKVDFFELHQFNNLGTDLFYEFLNLGCKLTASAGSDVPWGGRIGEVRVYSYLNQEEFSADRWFEAFGRGRTFTTSGPMIEFRVDDALPGDELVVTPGRKLRVRARAWADPNHRTPIRLEIVRHGDVIRAANSREWGRPEVELDFTIDAGDGFWIAARARTGFTTSAHTSPVYVVREGLRFWKYEAVDALIAKRLTSLSQIEDVIADAQRLDREGRLEANRERKKLAVLGPELLERVAAARKLYADFREIAAAERSLRHAGAVAEKVASDPAGWVRVAEQNFPVDREFPHWRLEGSGELSTTMYRMLLMQTRPGHIQGKDTDASVVWFDQPAAGDVRIEFDAMAGPGSACEFLFNARPRGAAGSLFDWQRPRAEYRDYAADGKLELYAIDILGSDAETVALRSLGGEESMAVFRQLLETPGNDASRERLKESFDQLTVLQRARSPFGPPETSHHFDVRVTGARVTVLVDGRVLCDVVDKARKDRPLAGGYFGFRNARPGELWFDNVRVYRASRPQ